jgi:DNA-binding response OmpR family regulator
MNTKRILVVDDEPSVTRNLKLNIFLTAIVSNEETDGHEMISGGDTFLAKPVDIGKLKKAVEQHIRRFLL